MVNRSFRVEKVGFLFDVRAKQRFEWLWLTAGLIGLIGLIVGCGQPRQSNLVLISLDTVRADHCSVYGYDRPTTPTLEALADQGIVFDRAYSTTAVTAPSHASLFTGLMPQTHGLRRNGERLGTQSPTLAEILSGMGYQTAGVASSFVLNSSFGLNRGFDFWEDDFSIGASKHLARTWEGQEVPGGFDRRADQTTDLGIDWLRFHRQSDRPFFLFVHYFEPHGPYHPPEMWREKFALDERAANVAQMIAAYDAGLAFTDAEVGRFLEFLDELGLADDTLVVVTADHGEGLMSHGAMAHGPHLYDEAVRIPLVIRWPNRVPAGRRSSVAVGLQDIAPTLFEMFGIEAEVSGLRGRTFASALVSATSEEPIPPVFLFRGSEKRKWVGNRWVEGERLGVIEGRWKLLTSVFEEDELFDRDVDPFERTNLASTHPGEVRRLKDLLVSWDIRGEPRAGHQRGLTEQEQRGLEALGYKP